VRSNNNPVGCIIIMLMGILDVLDITGCNGCIGRFVGVLDVMGVPLYRDVSTYKGAFDAFYCVFLSSPMGK
jgi:hypothetical protein